MTSATAGFAPIGQVERVIQANATHMGGWTVNQAFNPEIYDILRNNTVFWQLIRNKVAAPGNIVQKIRKLARPSAAFVDKFNLTTLPQTAPAVAIHQNDMVDSRLNLDDPGQEIKAIAGTVEFDHYPRSLANQQGNPYLNEVVRQTEDLLVETSRKLEMALFRGSVATDPLQFNGLDAFCQPEHTFTADITAAEPDSIADKLNEICMRATTDRNVIRKITHIFCSGAGSLFLRREMDDRLIYSNLVEIVPGVQVPAILSAEGRIPIVSSPYVTDVDGGAGADTLTYYLIDMSTLEWNGVYPFGGAKTLEPQIFDISNTINGLPLLEKRMVLMYGCLYPDHGAEGIWKLNVTAPSGSTWSPQNW